MPRRRRDHDPTLDGPLDGPASSANTSSPPPPRKKTCRVPTPAARVDAYVHRSYKPRVKHRNHPESGVGENFHSVPYPLSLMPYSSWHVLHHRRDANSSEHRFVCPVNFCRKHRFPPSAHRQKLFLVAERLSWEDGMVSTAERELNQELMWDVNFQLQIEDLALEDPEQVPGGKNSKTNQWFPFENEADCVAALKLIAQADCLTKRSYALWSMMLETLYTALPEEETQDAPSQLASKAEMDPWTEKAAASHLPTPPSSSQPVASQASQDPASTEHSSSPHPYRAPPPVTGSEPTAPPARPIHRSLPDFYALLDAIERTSYVGAQFLEAYAEHLHADVCEDCWWSCNISTDPEIQD